MHQEIAIALEIDFILQILTVLERGAMKSKWTLGSIFKSTSLKNNHRKNYRNTRKLNNRPRKI
jgi:hypothetical protein